MDEAITRRLEFSHKLLGVRDSEPVLSRLGRDGYPLGIVTDCSVETPEVWPTTWLCEAVDAVPFSCLPAQESHVSGTTSRSRRNWVDVSSCVGVGDGGSQELSGARHAADPSQRSSGAWS